MIQWTDIQKLKTGQFEKLTHFHNCIHGFSTRVGGISPEPYDSLNLGFNTADTKDNVNKNRDQFFTALGISKDQTVFPQQVHSDHIEIVDIPGSIPATDGLITATSDLFLTIQTADCIPIFVVDPVKQISALFHAGWRGTNMGIVSKGIHIMADVFGCEPSNLYAGLGPGIGPCCFKVAKDVAANFPNFLSAEQYVDLWAANIHQLVASGIKNDYISVTTLCTSCHPALFFSHRREKGATGRMMAVVGFRS
ncbi:peptidoglycan editing factor PgeF [bacterium]|nr:peptidoglycan editing factor PgeF [bacterium]